MDSSVRSRSNQTSQLKDQLGQGWSFLTDLRYIPLLLLLFALLARFLPHPPNFSPLAAIFLFGGVYLSRGTGLLVPLLALFISDLFLGFYGAVMFFVYGSFLAIGVMSWWLRQRKTARNVVAVSLTASFLFFLVTNFGVWLATPMYSQDLSGLIACYTAALPFFRNTILGDLFYTGVLFGLYETAKAIGVRYLPAKTVAAWF